MIDHIGLVENNSDLIIVSLQRFNRASKFIGYVKLVCVKKQNYAINSLSKPLKNARKVVASTKIIGFMLIRQSLRGK